MKNEKLIGSTAPNETTGEVYQVPSIPEDTLAAMQVVDMLEDVELTMVDVGEGSRGLRIAGSITEGSNVQAELKASLGENTGVEVGLYEPKNSKPSLRVVVPGVGSIPELNQTIDIMRDTDGIGVSEALAKAHQKLEANTKRSIGKMGLRTEAMEADLFAPKRIDVLAVESPGESVAVHSGRS